VTASRSFLFLLPPSQALRNVLVTILRDKMPSEAHEITAERIWPPGKGPELLPDELLAYIFEIGTWALPDPLRDPVPADQPLDGEDDDEWDTDAEAEGEAGKELEAQAKAEDKDMEIVEEKEEEEEEGGYWDRIDKRLAAMPRDLPPFQIRVSQVSQKWRSK
jgi:hypothetical protein